MFFKKGMKNNKTIFCSPVSGDLVPLSQVQDEAFSSEVLGNGFAIKPTTNLLLSPFDGKVEMLFETYHAIGLKDSNGNEYLIHIGIDTVYLEGKGFHPYIEVGKKVKTGQKLIEFSLDLIKESGYEPIIIIVCTKNVTDNDFSVNKYKRVNANDVIIEM